jgi:glycosyltransferase involved in cell wall biosynthesis
MTPSEKKADQTATHKQANKPVKDTAVRQQVEAAQSSNEVLAKPSSASTAAGKDTAGAAAKTAAAEAVIASRTGSETGAQAAVAAVPEVASKVAVSRIAEVKSTVGEVPSEAPVSKVAAPIAPVSEAPGRETAAAEPPVSEAPPIASVPAVAIVQPLEEPRHEEPKYVRPPLENKYLNKEALRDRLWLRKEFKPIIAYVGRLDYQKGVHLIRHGIFYALHHGAQFVLLGVSPEHRINEEFWQLKRQLNDSPDCHLEIGFNEELSHLIYAGSDMIIMPSLYEPCGLTQMIALKYGTVPIVRAVGGLVDTVFDRDYASRPLEERNGYVFHEADAAGLESAMSRAIGLWYSYPDEFRKLIINGMKYDYSWNYPGQHYLNIYEHIRCK